MWVGLTNRDPLLPLGWLSLACPSMDLVQLDVLVRGAVVWSGELGFQLLTRHCKANTQIFHQHVLTDTLEGGDSLSSLMHVCVLKEIFCRHSCGWDWWVHRTHRKTSVTQTGPVHPGRLGRGPPGIFFLSALCFYSLQIKVGTVSPLQKLPSALTMEFSPSSVVFSDF